MKHIIVSPCHPEFIPKAFGRVGVDSRMKIKRQQPCMPAGRQWRHLLFHVTRKHQLPVYMVVVSLYLINLLTFNPLPF